MRIKTWLILFLCSAVYCGADSPSHDSTQTSPSQPPSPNAAFSETDISLTAEGLPLTLYFDMTIPKGLVLELFQKQESLI